jgi:hypothetical protein
MPTEQLVFFAVWVVVALLAGGLIVFAWERLRRKLINRS